MAMFVVSPHGDNDNPGTLDAPFRTIEKGLAAVTAGDVLALRGGSYAEDVVLADLAGRPEAPIVIRPWAREEVTVDGADPVYETGGRSDFRMAGNTEWVLAALTDADAHPDEYVSRERFAGAGDANRVDRGAFVDLARYTRLITYSQILDLRATNQTFGRLPAPDGTFPIVDDDGAPIPVILPDNGGEIPRFTHPFVYMGPGVFFDHDGDQRVHIRLSHTSNGIVGLADYAGATDPRQVRLALSRRSSRVLSVQNCTSVRLQHLTFRFGGNQTVRINDSTDVQFDHVSVLAGTVGVRLSGQNAGITFSHCEFAGGVPTWMFRSDIKAHHRWDTGAGIIESRLGAGTSDALLAGPGSDNQDTLIHYCEFVDGHDLLLFGRRTRFHHNWIRNLHDDALIIGADGVTDLELHHNVITRSLTALNLESGSAGGPRRVSYNLFDLRELSAGIRPRPAGHIVAQDDVEPVDGVFRSSVFYKSDAPDGPLDLFQNTCLIRHRNSGRAAFQHYVSPSGGQRRSFNNVFLDIEPTPDREGYSTVFLPAPTFRGPTDGNCMRRVGGDAEALLQHAPPPPGGQLYANLAAYHGSTHFDQSKVQYSPGFEAASIDLDPQLRRIDPAGVAQFDDDLRLQPTSPALAHGVVLAGPGVGIDDPFAPADAPSIGCFTADDPGFRVGVDGRRCVPESLASP